MRILKYQYGGIAFSDNYDFEDSSLDKSQLRPNNRLNYNPPQINFSEQNKIIDYSNNRSWQQPSATAPVAQKPWEVRRETRRNNREVRRNNRDLRQMSKDYNNQYRLGAFNQLDGNAPSGVQRPLMEERFRQDPTQGFTTMEDRSYGQAPTGGYTTMEDRHNLPVQGGWRPMSYQEGGSALSPWMMLGNEETANDNYRPTRFDRKQVRLNNQQNRLDNRQDRLNLKKANLYRQMEGLPRINRDYTAADGFVHPLEYLDPTPPGYVEPESKQWFVNNYIERKPSNVVWSDDDYRLHPTEMTEAAY